MNNSSWDIDLNDVSVTFRNGTTALKHVTLHIDAGEMVAVVGLSGSGKSTLIRTINGLVTPTSGTVTVGPYEITSLSGRAMREARGHIGMIFQAFNLAERTSVYRNVQVGRFAHTPTWRSLLGMPSQGDKEVAIDALTSVDILDKIWVRAGELSGGQKQRVAIARALAQEPSVMLADEPVASLDPPTAHAVMQDLKRINDERDLTVLCNLHDIDLARTYTTRLIALRAGKVVFDGPTAQATDEVFEEIYGKSGWKR